MIRFHLVAILGVTSNDRSDVVWWQRTLKRRSFTMVERPSDCRTSTATPEERLRRMSSYWSFDSSGRLKYRTRRRYCEILVPVCLSVCIYAPLCLSVCFCLYPCVY